MFEHVRYAITGVLGAVQSYTFGAVLGAHLNEKEFVSYINAYVECRRLEALAMSRFKGEVEMDVGTEPFDFREAIDDGTIDENGKIVEKEKFLEASRTSEDGKTK